MKKKGAIEFITNFLKENPEIDLPVSFVSFELRNKRFGLPAGYLFYDAFTDELCCRSANHTRTELWPVDISKLYKDDLLRIVDECNQ